MGEFDTLIGLVSRYSSSGQEHDAAEWLVERMKSLHYNKAFLDQAGNAVGVMGHGKRQVVLLGHIDNVPGEIASRVVDGILYGRGSVDAKGPLASFADAVAEVGVKEGWQFVVIGAVEEERDSEGARFVVNQYQPEFVIIGEPNQWDRLGMGYKGSAWANVCVSRRQVHSASGEQTAPEAAIEIWLHIKNYVDLFNTERTKAFDRILLTLRGMDSASDDFEQWARLRVGVRLPLDVPPETWYTKLKELAGEATVEPTGYAIPAWACEKNTQLVKSFLRGVRSQGGEPRFVYKTGTSDLNITIPVWKCPALVYGPGDSALDHTPNEHISLDEYAKAVSVLSHALADLTNENQTNPG